MHSSSFHQKLFKFSALPALFWPREFQFTSALDGRTTVKRGQHYICLFRIKCITSCDQKEKLLACSTAECIIFKNLLFGCSPSLCPLRRFEEKKIQQK